MHMLPAALYPPFSGLHPELSVHSCLAPPCILSSYAMSSNPFMRFTHTHTQLTFDGSVLTTTDGNTIRFWDTASMAVMKEVSVPYPVEAASYCPSKKRFAAGAGHGLGALEQGGQQAERSLQCKGQQALCARSRWLWRH